VYTLGNNAINVNSVYMKTTRQTRKPPYHHGNLARDLIEHALAQVRSAGAGSVSLREAAKAAGVTAGAVYKHYENRDALLAAVSKDGFRRLSLMMQDGTQRKTGKARLVATGRAYIAFASAEPDLFRLMFSGVKARYPVGIPEAFSSQTSPYQHFLAALADVVGCEPADVDESLAAHGWCVAHGAASLICDGVWSVNDRRAQAALAGFADFVTTASRQKSCD